MKQLPGYEPRIETGVVQFGDDWPGVFLRGDTACHYAVVIQQVIDNVDKNGYIDALDVVILRSLAGLLGSCDARLIDEEEK